MSVTHIPLHLIVDIVLAYTELEQWKTARTLNSTSKEIVSNQKYDDGCWGRRTMIIQNSCHVCSKKNKNLKWLRYPADDVIRQRWIGHCNTWYCTISAIKSMLSDYATENIFILRTPWLPSNNVNIPRSDGSTSSGTAKTDCVRHMNKKTYVHVDWIQNGEIFSKLVPLGHYTNDQPKYLAI
tara:strand:+ start:1653 stop:2198 length:546 start_codon:yes stop_codon:yes gene_type:complete